MIGGEGQAIGRASLPPDEVTSSVSLQFSAQIGDMNMEIVNPDVCV